ncbi:DUF418 domain-containing protein [Staphylococcus gallinarum]|uniref:DUF418 domain-containing protein n=1 Tax=Staphylococcus gallinarum TaxID=1293 RepID=UPI002DBD7498|nr:DUF418 domain-containing protein [Staphylococcus gallinarum]MEB7037702.1 DUF418 domain-containing protein [Staphylococcus gallinarum]
MKLSSRKRLFELDALRGFSLLGIILMNILSFSLPYEQAFLPDIINKGLDEWILRLITLVVISSFYPIFTFLFGYGLAIMYANSETKDLRYYPFIYRRLSFLLILGLVHGLFIFSGDILFGYAFTGMIAVLFIKWRPRKLVKLAIILFSLKVILLVIPFSLITWFTDPYGVTNFTGKTLGQLINIRQSGGYSAFLGINIKEYIFRILDVVTTSSYFEFLPYILLGIAAQKSDLIAKVRQNKSKMVYRASILVVCGYLIKLPHAIDYGNNALINVSSMVGGPIVAAGYILIFIVLCQYGRSAQILSVFKYPGRLSLSIYLSQSIIFTLIYMGFGLGLFNKLALYQSYLIVVVVYAIQLIMCYFYLKQYKQGPIEWLWRKVTYLK